MSQGVSVAALAHDRRNRVKDQIPSLQCKSKSKRSGLQCRRYALVGADVCIMHGGSAPQVKAKAEERITLAERLATAPKRPYWDVLDEAAHLTDVLMQDARAAIASGNFTVTDLEKLVGAIDRAVRVNTSNVHAGLAERRQRFHEAQAQQMHRFVMAVLNGLTLTAEQKALVPAVVKREIEGVLVRQAEIAA
jgi:hypothetical protein